MPKPTTALSTQVFAQAKDAPLPVRYEAAKAALAEVDRIDECKEWVDRMVALRSYARQIQDESMIKAAMRIHGRAVRRAGELLEAMEAAQGSRSDLELRDGDGPKLSPRRAAAASVGLSERQQKTAQQVARIPEPIFEAAIESEDPPTITELAERGKQKREAAIRETWGLPETYEFPADPDAFNDGIHWPGAVEWMLRFTFKTNRERMVAAMKPETRAKTRALIVRGFAFLNHVLEELDRVENTEPRD